MNKKNIKWLLIICFSSIVIILNGFQYFKAFKSKSQKRKIKTVNFEKYYDKEVTNIILSLNDRLINIANNSNKLIIGLDSHDDKVRDYISRIKSGIELSNYDIDLYFLTKNSSRKIDGVVIEKYKNQEFDNFFEIVDCDYFIFLIDSYNKIKFYQIFNLPKPKNVQSLIKRYRKL